MSKRAANASRIQKRSLAPVSILQSLAAAEIANALHLRDFRSPVIFEFFNTIRQKRSFRPFMSAIIRGGSGSGELVVSSLHIVSQLPIAG